MGTLVGSTSGLFIYSFVIRLAGLNADLWDRFESEADGELFNSRISRTISSGEAISDKWLRPVIRLLLLETPWRFPVVAGVPDPDAGVLAGAKVGNAPFVNFKPDGLAMPLIATGVFGSSDGEDTRLFEYVWLWLPALALAISFALNESLSSSPVAIIMPAMAIRSGRKPEKVGGGLNTAESEIMTASRLRRRLSFASWICDSADPVATVETDFERRNLWLREPSVRSL